jgi:hypothetical protein
MSYLAMMCPTESRLCFENRPVSSMMSGEDPPFCISCHQTLTVEHIFLHCVELDNIRNALSNVSTLNEPFKDINPNVLFQFLREAGFYSLF